MTEPPNREPPPAPVAADAPATVAWDLPETLGPYRIEGRLGRGGMGIVYRAFDERLHRRVALKQIRPERADSPRARERFLREARAAARLNHPNIVQIYDVLEARGALWIVMELVEGQPLQAVLAAGPPEAAAVASLARQVALALAAAHDQGILHRDLKTENVLVTPDGVAKILDFGLAKLRHGDAEAPSLSLDGQVLGTARAMSPEQVAGEDLDERSDLFSLGTLIYETVTGSSPFLAANDFVTMSRVCAYRPPPASRRVPGTPPRLDRLIDRLLAKDRDRRPAGAREVAAELEEIARSAGEVTVPRASSPAPATDLPEDTRPTALMPGAPPAATPGATPGATGRRSVERRQVTVLCCGLVSATEGSSASFDPEALFEVTPVFQARSGEVIERFGGHLEEARGHRLVACFGFPRAHGDDARRAVLAALELGVEVGRLAAEVEVPGLALRAGIHTGPAVATGGSSRRPRLSLGQTLDLGDALEDLASPGTTVVSGASRPLIDAFFELDALPPARFPGFVEPLELHRVRSARASASRPGSGAAPAPMVGREQELALVLDRWRRASEGSGQVVLVSGDPGIGKSRLVEDLAGRLAGTSTRWLAAAASSYAQGSPFFAVGEVLRQAADSSEVDPPEDRLEGLETLLEQHGLSVTEVAPLLAGVLSLPTGDRYPPVTLPPEGRRERTLEAVTELLLSIAARQGAALVIEDLHWADPSTLELLGRLIDRAGSEPLLLLATFRRHFTAPWGHRAGVTQLTLDRLSAEQAGEVIERLGGASLPLEVRRQIVERADGVPLFVEELTKTVLAAESLREAPAIPATLQDSLTARLDRLGSAREVAQLAAVCGREFTAELLAAVSPLEAAELARALDRLVAAEIVVRRRFPAPSRYVFKHALIRDAAYGSLLRRRRRELHRAIGEALESGFPETRDGHPELLAHHFTEARDVARAADYWRRAGEQAFQRAALDEAVAHLRAGLRLLETLPPGDGRDGAELGLSMVLGSALAASRGFGAPEVNEAFDRAFEACSRRPDSPELFWVVWGLFRFHLARASFDKTEPLAERLHRLAGETEERALRMAAFWASGFSRTFRGELEAAHADCRRVIDDDAPGRERPDASLAGEDFGVNALSFDAVLWWHLGLPERAAASGEESLELAGRVGHPLVVCLALNHNLLLHQQLRDPPRVAELAERLLELSREAGPWWRAWAEMYLGWARAMAGDAPGAEALEQIRGGLQGFRAGGARLFLPYFLGRLAEVQLGAGRVDDARGTLEQALAVVEATDQRIDEPEICRLRARCEPAEGGDAETWLERALEAARRLGSKSLELRAAVDLARLWAESGLEDRARELLEPIYDAFTEGRATPDLQDAKSLLDDPG